MTTPRSDQFSAPATSPYGAATARPASTPDAAVWAVRTAAAVVALAGLAMMLVGFVFIGQDMDQRGEMFDGLGAMIGLAVCALAALFLGVAAMAAWWVRRRPMAAAVTVCVFGVLVALVGISLVGGAGLLVAAPTLLGGLVVSGLGFGAAVAAQR